MPQVLSNTVKQSGILNEFGEENIIILWRFDDGSFGRSSIWTKDKKNLDNIVLSKTAAINGAFQAEIDQKLIVEKEQLIELLDTVDLTDTEVKAKLDEKTKPK